MARIVHVIVLLVILIALPISAGAGDPQLSDDTGRQILEELKQIKTLLQNQPRLSAQGSQPIRTAKVEVGGAPFMGPENAPITIVEFTDFQCPFCQRFHQQTFPELKKNYIDPGLVRFYSMDLPLEIHQDSMVAAEAGRCANEQGQFWAMRARMQDNPSKLNISDLMSYAGDLGIDPAKLRTCIESEKYKPEIQKQAQAAIAKGAVGTPTLVIGRSTPTGVSGELILGFIAYNVLDQKLGGLR